VNLLYHPAQEAFLNALALRTPEGKRAYFQLLMMSGRRGGKTKGGAIAGAREAAVPNTLGWACAPSFPELHDYVIPALREAIPEDWIVKWSEEHKEFTLINGSRIQCRSLDDPERGRGPGLDWLWIDEGRKVDERAWETILPALMDKQGVAWVTTSPAGFDWVYRLFLKPAIEGVPGYWATKFKSSENPINTEESIARIRSAMGEMFARQELDAELVNFTGAVYGDLIDGQVIVPGSEHLVIPEWPDINPSRVSLVGIDPGTDHPFGAGLAVMTEQGMVWVGEYLERNQPMSHHVKEIRLMERGLQPTYVYDKAAKQIALELAQHGIYAQPCDNSVEGGIRRVESWLVSKRMWFLESRVPRMIEQMRAYRWANNVGKDGQARNKERVFKVDDEMPDVCRYTVMSWPEMPEPNKIVIGRDPATVPEQSRWAWDREQRINKWEPASETGVSDFFGGEQG
jgi:hypothetical protein